MNIKNKFIIFMCLPLIILCSCTINIIQTDTHGQASDVVDETSSAQAQIAVPINGI